MYHKNKEKEVTELLYIPVDEARVTSRIILWNQYMKFLGDFDDFDTKKLKYFLICIFNFLWLPKIYTLNMESGVKYDLPPKKLNWI